MNEIQSSRTEPTRAGPKLNNADILLPSKFDWCFSSQDQLGLGRG